MNRDDVVETMARAMFEVHQERRGYTSKWDDFVPADESGYGDHLQDFIDQAEAALASLSQAQPDEGLVEAAEKIHAAMVWAAKQAGEPQDWQNGNSIAEDKARACAKEVTALSRNRDEALERAAKKALRLISHGSGDHPDTATRQVNINSAWHVLNEALKGDSK